MMIETSSTPRPATPAKLRDGSWGARVRGPVQAGDTVTITTSAGKTWQARVERVVWTGEGVTLCATSSLDRASTPAPAATYGGRIEASRQAWGRARGMGSGHGQAAAVAGYPSYCTDSPSCRCYDCAS